MNINQLATKVLQQHVTRDSGAGELVDYIHVNSGLIENIKCYPQNIELEQNTDTLIENSMIFHGLFLLEPPSKNDIIKYNNISWKVDSIKISCGAYDIYAYDARHTLGTRR